MRLNGWNQRFVQLTEKTNKPPERFAPGKWSARIPERRGRELDLEEVKLGRVGDQAAWLK